MLATRRATAQPRHSGRHLGLAQWLVGCAVALFAWELSARPPTRVVADVTVRDSRLAAEVRDLAAWVEGRGGHLSLAFVSTRDGSTLAAHGADRPQNPASTLKLLTALTALDRFGPARRFQTSVHSVMVDGHAPRLVLRGEGDPSLEEIHLDAMAAQLVRRGLRRVSGDILVDQSRFDDQLSPPGFDAQPAEQAAFRAVVTPVALSRNAVTVHVAPDKDGRAARVWLTPEGAFRLEGKVDTAARGKGQKVGVTVTGHPLGVVVRVSGTVAEGLPTQRIRRRVSDPRLVPGAYLRHALIKAGAQVDGQVRLGTTNDPPLALHQSPPLSVLLHALGKDSDNFSAEMLLKRLGAEGRETGTSRHGAEAVLDWMRKAGAIDATTKVRNGSGLFDGGRVSASSLCRALAAGHRDPRLSSEFIAHLAIGGVDGTLRSRFVDQRATLRVRGKTGTLARVVALSGYLFPQHGDAVAFAILAEGNLPHAEARKRVDRVVSRALTNAERPALTQR